MKLDRSSLAALRQEGKDKLKTKKEFWSAQVPAVWPTGHWRFTTAFAN